MSSQRYIELKDTDQRHLWHPFTQMRVWLDDEPLIIERGEGNYLIDVEGRRYLDGVSSLWCNVHGHRKAELDQALKAQVDRIAHSTMLGMSNVPAIELSRELIKVVPSGLSRVFYSDSGAGAVEVAIRMATQYWQLLGQSSRGLFLTLTESYHGDTLGAVSLGYSERFHRHIKHMLSERVLKTDPPHVYRFDHRMIEGAALEASLKAGRETIERHKEQLAALVIEPIVQGAAGMWVQPPEYLRAMAEMARRAGALVICDEVATGFGRTGKLFACEHAALSPDLLCLGKGITGGYMPLAATLTTEKIFEAFLGRPDEYRAFYYGHTYTGNPLAAAVAVANLKIFSDEQVIERIQPRIEQLKDGLRRRFGSMPNVADIRQCGLMAGVELMRDPAKRVPYATQLQTGATVIKAARRRGVAIRPLGDVIIFMPPLSITEAELDTLMDVTSAAVHEVTAAL